jgi:nicotinamide mononucleotide (NMN) deamidase PncC
MAIGVLRRSRATVGGVDHRVAGPDEDEDGYPVGLVYCGVARNNDTHRHIRLKCTGTPDAIVEEACIEALRFLRSFCIS